MNELALFAGAGGGIYGGAILGWRTVCAVEFNAFCASVLMERQNDGSLSPFPVWDDVRTFDGCPWRGLVDVISGGFPCQDISSCNPRGRGVAGGAKSGLWAEMARIIGEVSQLMRSSKTRPYSQTKGSTSCSEILPRWGTMQNGACLARIISVPCITENECGYWLPTPIKSDARLGQSISRALRKDVRIQLSEMARVGGGHLSPEWIEWLMGWPIGSTDLQPLAMDKFRSWLQQHLPC